MTKHYLIRAGAIAFLTGWTCIATDVFADPVDFGDNKVPTRTLEFTDDNDLGGQVARFDGIVPEKGQRLIVKGLDVMSPLVVRVLAKDTAMPVDVSLHRYFWGKPDAQGTTGSQGEWGFQGRAHEEIGIALSAPVATPVYALVWQGPAVPAAPVPTVITDTQREAGESGGIDFMTLGIVGLLAVIAILLALQLLQRRSTTAAGMILVAFLTMATAVEPVNAQSNDKPPPNPFADEADKPSADSPPPNPFADEADKPPAEQPPNPFADEGDKPPAEQPPNPFADDQKPRSDFKPEDPGPKPQESASSSAAKPEPGSEKPPASASSGAPRPEPGSDKPPASASNGDSKIKPDPGTDKPPASNNTGDSKLKPDSNSDKPQTADSKLKPDPNSDKPNTADNKLKPDPDSDKPQTADSKLKPDPDSEKPTDTSKPKPEESQTAEADTELGSDDPTSSSGESGSGSDAPGRGDLPFQDRLDAVYADIRSLRNEVASNSARIRTLEFLINQDREAVPAPGDGAPPISVSCDNNRDCQACLQEANNDLSELLVNLDKLRIIYMNYMDYRDYMVGLGDAISGFHQLEQAAWYQTKLQIEEATIGLQAAYDAKFDEFKGTLSESLATLSACDSVDGDPVFSRESVLFENYVKAKYARDY